MLARACDSTVVAFETDDLEPDGQSGWSVLVVGTAELLDGSAAVRAVERGVVSASTDGDDMSQFVAITMTKVTGRDSRASTFATAPPTSGPRSDRGDKGPCGNVAAPGSSSASPAPRSPSACRSSTRGFDADPSHHLRRRDGVRAGCSRPVRASRRSTPSPCWRWRRRSAGEWSGLRPGGPAGAPAARVGAVPAASDSCRREACLRASCCLALR
jgi:hypothetical protein